MLDQHTEKSFHTSQQRAMYHIWAVRSSIFADIFETESLRQIEVKLNRRELPFASQSVHHFEIDLGSIEGTASFIYFIWNLVRVDCPAQCFCRHIPIGWITNVLLRHRR